VLSHLEHAATNRAHVTQISKLCLAQTGHHARLGLGVAQSPQPCIELRQAADCEHAQNVIERLHDYKTMLSGRRLPQLLRQIRRPRMVVPLEHAQILVAGDRRQFDQVRKLPGQRLIAGRV
jgi:hypothetical protein